MRQSSAPEDDLRKGLASIGARLGRLIKTLLGDAASASPGDAAQSGLRLAADSMGALGWKGVHGAGHNVHRELLEKLVGKSMVQLRLHVGMLRSKRMGRVSLCGGVLHSIGSVAMCRTHNGYVLENECTLSKEVGRSAGDASPTG